MPMFVYLIVVLAFLWTAKKITQANALRQYAAANQCHNVQRENSFDILGLAMPLRITYNFQKSNLLSWTKELFEKHNGTFASTILGEDYIFTSNPENVKHLLSIQFNDFDTAVTRQHLFKEFSTRGVLTLDGHEWTVSREQLRSQFSHYRAIVDLEKLERHFLRFASLIPRDGVTVDLQELFSRLAMDTASEFELGTSLDSLLEDQCYEKRRVADSIRYVMDTIAEKGFWGPFHWIVGRRKFPEAGETFRQHVLGFAIQALDKHDEKEDSKKVFEGQTYCFVSSLAAEEKDLEILRDQASNVVLAGVDSMPSLLSATFWLLARDEYAFRVLKEQIIEVCGSEPATYDQLKSLTYLRYVLNEALRLYPPVPFDMRIAKHNTTLPFNGGKDINSKILVKKGQGVVFSSYSAHRRVDIYGPDANEFKPKRWEKLKMDGGGFFPFHIGPRSCPGQQLALTTASYMVTRIIQSFPRMESRDSRDWKENISMTLGNGNGVLVGLFSA